MPSDHGCRSANVADCPLNVLRPGHAEDLLAEVVAAAPQREFLVLWGGSDRAVSFRGAPRVRQLVPRAEMVEWPSADHMTFAQVEEPASAPVGELFRRRLLRFLLDDDDAASSGETAESANKEPRRRPERDGSGGSAAGAGSPSTTAPLLRKGTAGAHQGIHNSNI